MAARALPATAPAKPTCQSFDVRSVDASKICGAPAAYVGDVVPGYGRGVKYVCEACAFAIDHLGGWRTGSVRRLP